MSRLFFGGMPTGMDVDKLMRLGAEPGMSISYEEVERIIGVSWRTNRNRFRTVTDAWRKRLMREHHLQTLAEGGVFVFMTPDQAHDEACKSVSKVGRATGRLRLRVETINALELSGERQARHNLLRRESQAMHEASISGAKAIAAPRASTGATVRLVQKA